MTLRWGLPMKALIYVFLQMLREAQKLGHLRHSVQAEEQQTWRGVRDIKKLSRSLSLSTKIICHSLSREPRLIHQNDVAMQSTHVKAGERHQHSCIGPREETLQGRNIIEEVVRFKEVARRQPCNQR